MRICRPSRRWASRSTRAAICFRSACKQAFSGSTSAAIFDAILHSNPPAAERVNPILPAELNRVIGRLIEKDPDLRYQTAADLRADLKRLPRDTTSGYISVTEVAAVAAERRKHKVPRWAWITLGAAVLAIGAVAAWFYETAPAKYSGPPPRVTPLTSSPGVKLSLTLSPNGNEVAFSWQGEKNRDANLANIYVQLVGAGTPLQLTNTKCGDFFFGGPVWSPDGRFIAFGRVTGNAAGYYEIPALGGAERISAGQVFRRTAKTWLSNAVPVIFQQISA